MKRDPAEQSATSAAIQLTKNGIATQWGGKLAFFFAYIHFSHDLTTGLLSALLPFIRQDLGLNYLQSGLLVSAYAFTSGLSQFMGGLVADRIGRSRAISLGLGGVGLSAIGVGLAPSYYSLLAVLVVLGVMGGFYHPSAVSAISSQFEKEHRGRAVALHMAGGSIGFGISPVLGAVISNSLNWHVAFIVLGIPAVVAAPLALTQLKLASSPRQPGLSSSFQSVEHKPIGLRQAFRPIIAIVVVSVATQLISGLVMSFASLFLVDVHHLSAAAASMWMTIIRVGGLIGGLFGGWLSDTWGRRKTIFLTLVLSGLAVSLVARLSYGVGLGAASILFGWLMTMRETTMQTLLMDTSPPHLRATVIGIYFGFGQEGSSLIQPVAGDFMDTLGIATVYIWISYIALALATVVLILAMQKPLRTDASASPS